MCRLWEDVDCHIGTPLTRLIGKSFPNIREGVGRSGISNLLINLVSLCSHYVRQRLSAERRRLHLKMLRISRKFSCTLLLTRTKRTRGSRSCVVLSTRRYMTSLDSVMTCSLSNINPRQVRGVESSQLSVGSNACNRAQDYHLVFLPIGQCTRIIGTFSMLWSMTVVTFKTSVSKHMLSWDN